MIMLILALCSRGSLVVCLSVCLSACVASSSLSTCGVVWWSQAVEAIGEAFQNQIVRHTHLYFQIIFQISTVQAGMLVEAKFIYIDENMDNQKNCRSIKQARLIVNAHKRNLLNSFCNNGYVYVKQHENIRKSLKNRDRERERMLLCQ